MQRQHKEWEGIPATGRKAEWTVIIIGWFEGEKLAKDWSSTTGTIYFGSSARSNIYCVNTAAMRARRLARASSFN
jgi:hypothetical protein